MTVGAGSGTSSGAHPGTCSGARSGSSSGTLAGARSGALSGTSSRTLSGALSGALLTDVLASRAALDPAATAYVFLDDEGEERAALTYGDLHSRALACAGDLAGHCAPGERALLLFPPGLDFIVAFFACLYARVIAVPVNPPRRNGLAAAAQSIVRDCAPTTVLTSSSKLAVGQAALQAVGEGLHWLAVDEAVDRANRAADRAGRAASLGVGGGDQAVGLVGLSGLPGPAFRPEPPAPDSIAFLQYTSGSTADPKGVMVSHANLCANERMIARGFGHDQDSTVVGWAPFFHDQGLIGNVLQPLWIGSTSILMSPMTFARWPLRWLSAISKYRAHTSGGPNFAFDACVARAARGNVPDLDLSCWQVAFNGAEPIRPETLSRFSETFAPFGFRPEAFYPCYGLAEATLLVTGSRKGRGPRTLTVDADELGRRRYVPVPGGPDRTLVGSGLVSSADPVDPGKLGSPGSLGDSGDPGSQGADVRIVDPATGRPCAPDEVGEIWVAGPHVARGYWRRLEVTEATFLARCDNEPDRAYLRTGDLGFIADGELYVVGRLKDLVIIRGRNYYPQDIEQTVVASHPALNPGGCAAFSVSASAGGEQLVVVQEIKRDEGALAGASDIAGSIRAAVIRDHQLSLGDLVLTPAGQLQKTSSGKIMRAAARKRYLEDGFQAWPRPRATKEGALT